MHTAPPARAMLIRPSTVADLPAITAIYADAVLHGTGTFELDPPDEREMAARREGVLANGWPYLVAEREGVVIGYAYANLFRPRRAYRFCLEDSIYMAPAARGQGAGRVLLAELMARCEALGARQMLAVIGDSDNAGSIGVHRALGFEAAGVLKASGWKFGRWLDVVILQKALGTGDTTPPRSTMNAAPLPGPQAGARPTIGRPAGAHPKKPVAAWLALVGGAFGLHRFYLYGRRDLLGWLHLVPTLAGLAGVQRMRAFGQDDVVAWLLIPLLGLMLSLAMLHAIVYGLTSDEKWAARWHPGTEPVATGWLPVFAVIAALLVGGTVLMGTIAFGGQKFFEWQLAAEAQRSSQSPR